MRSSRAWIPVVVAAAAVCVPVAALAAPACAVTEAAVVGAWGRPSGVGVFEEFALEVEDGEHVFRSWLHQRPDVPSARWTYADCRLRIESSKDAKAMWDYAVAMRGRTRLVLRDADGTTTYRRIGH